MKKRLFLSILAMLPLSLLAQASYEPLLIGEKTWQMGCPSPQTGTSSLYEETRFCSSASFAGIPFRQMLTRPCQSDGTPTGGWTPTDTWIGEYGGMVLQLCMSDAAMPLHALMDFSMGVGDVLNQRGSSDDHYKVVVTAVCDTVIDSSTDRSVRRCLHVRSIACPEVEDIWVEGIGSLLYGFRGMWQPTGSVMQLMKCSDGGEILFLAEDPVTVSVDAVKAAVSNTTALYDLQGRRLRGKPSHGIYIQDGRKHVVK